VGTFHLSAAVPVDRLTFIGSAFFNAFGPDPVLASVAFGLWLTVRVTL
jgi:hypothetical protein